MKWTVEIYGTDTAPYAATAGFPLITGITALTYSKFTVYPFGLYPTINFNSNKTDYVGGYSVSTNSARTLFSVKCEVKEYPEADTSLDDYYPLEVLGKKYIFLRIPANYYLVPEEIKVNKENYGVEVIPIGASVEIDGSTKQLTLELERAYNE